MKRIHWPLYFKTGKEQIITEGEFSSIPEVIGQLNNLYRSDDIQANEIHQLLVYKYWPKEVYELLKHPQVRDMELQHEKSQEFRMDGLTKTSAELAYHTLSGRLDRIHTLLDHVGLEEYTGANLSGWIDASLSRNPDAFEIKCFYNEPEGCIEYCIPFYKTGGEYHADINKVTFISHPEIEHGVYNGIDSAALEKMMQEVNWHNDQELFRFDGDGDEMPEFLPKVYDIQEQIYRLSQDLVGGCIADDLQLKYWIGVTFFEDMIQPTAWDELDGRPKIQMEFPLDFTARSLFNLMCGRAVMDRTANEVERKSGVWLKLDLTQKDEQGMHPIQRITGFTMAEMEKQLRLLPIGANEYLAIWDAIAGGEITSIPVEGSRSILVVANPEQATLSLYTPDIRPIPFNFTFDPEWKPSETKQSDSLATEKRQGKAKQKPRSILKPKGKGM